MTTKPTQPAPKPEPKPAPRRLIGDRRSPFAQVWDGKDHDRA